MLALFYLMSFKLIELLNKILNNFYRILIYFKSIMIGFFIGLLRKNALKKIDQYFYNGEKHYTSDDYNKKELLQWEREALKNYFSDCRNLFVIAAGGGREVYNLSKLGYKVGGSEYNPKLRDYANIFLKNESVQSTIIEADRDICPIIKGKFDGIILGWSLYTHLKGSQKRIEFLRSVSDMLNIGGVVLLSFWSMRYSYMNLKRISRIGNFFSSLSKNEKIEIGDSIEPEFVHYFSREEVSKELRMANFDMVYFADEEYGHAIAIKKLIL
jgi:hypothetical protein